MESNVIKVFVSYAHASSNDKEKLFNELAIFENQGQVTLWADEKLNGGDKFNQIIKKNLDESDIGVILIDNNSIGISVYIRDEEIPMIFEKENDEEIHQFPILVEDCHWDQYEVKGFKFNEFNLIPKRKTKLTSVKNFLSHKKGWFEVSNEFKKLINSEKFKEFIKIKRQNINYIFDTKNIPNIIESYVRREKLETEILDWYFNGYQSLCYLIGQAGIGKTTLSRYIAKEIQENYNKDFVIWIESAEWEGYRDIETIIKKYFKKNNGESIELKEFIEKLDKNILIILDGVNEKDSSSVLKYIIDDYLEDGNTDEIESKNDNRIQNIAVKEKYIKIKFLLVTRNIEENIDKNLYKTIEVYGFNKLETEIFIEKNDEEIPGNFKNIITNPRYSKLASNLIDLSKDNKFYENFTKLSVNIRFNKNNLDADDLFYLMFYELIKNDKNPLVLNLMKKYFDKSSGSKEINALLQYDLESDSKIIDSIYFNDTSEDHIKVFYLLAIYIIKKCDNLDASVSIEEIVAKLDAEILNKFQSYGDDLLAKVPYLVFKLSVERFSVNKDKSNFHAALFYMWIKNHNTHYIYDDMMYWFEKDFDAFIQVFEKLNLEYQFVHVKDYLFNVLCLVWHESQGQNEELNNYLKSIFLGTTSYKEDYSIARFKRAIVILAHFPTEEFLDIFAKKVKDLSEENWGIYYLVKKDILNEFIPTLFRFGYQEDIFDVLIAKDDFKEIAKLYKSYSLSEKLSLKVQPIVTNNSVVSFIEKIKNNQKLLNDFDLENFGVSEVNGLANLACRKDLTLDNEDKKKVIETLEQLLSEFKKQENRTIFPYHWVYDNFPYLIASSDSISFNRINSQFLFQTIKQKANWYRVKGFHLAILPNADLPKYILSNIESLVIFEQDNEKKTFINQLIEVMLFTADDKQMENFFDYLIDGLNFPTIFTRNHPVYVYIRELYGTKLLDIIYAKLNKKLDKKLEETLMTYLFLLHDFSNVRLINWAIEKLEEKYTPIKHDKQNFYRDVLINSSPSKYFEDIYLHKDLKTYFYASNSSRGGAYLTYWLTREKGFYNDKPFNELIGTLPLDTVGNLLFHNERYDDINQWGKYIFDNLTPQDMNDYDVFEAIKKYSEQNNDEFEYYAIKYLTKANDNYEKGGRHFPSLRVFEDALITLLLPINFEKSVEFYNKTKKSQHISNSYNREIFNAKKYCDAKHTKYRKEYIQSLKNDMEILHIVKICCQNNSREELLGFIHEWLSSIYSTDRLLAVSLLAWFGDDSSIKLLESIKISDDSEYVRYFASYSLEVAKQEKYAKEIYEEVLQEDNLEVISAKLYQIKPVITPMVNQWGVELNEKYELYTDKTEKYKKVLIQRFWNIVSESINEDKKIEINQRRLLGYYRGEEITDANRFITGDFK